MLNTHKIRTWIIREKNFNKKEKIMRNALNSDLANTDLNYGSSFTLDKLNR